MKPHSTRGSTMHRKYSLSDIDLISRQRKHPICSLKYNIKKGKITADIFNEFNISYVFLLCELMILSDCICSALNNSFHAIILTLSPWLSMYEYGTHLWLEAIDTLDPPIYALAYLCPHVFIITLSFILLLIYAKWNNNQMKQKLTTLLKLNLRREE